MFRSTMNRGFHMEFANGLTVSVQWGRGNYCANRYGGRADESPNAEVAVWLTDGGRSEVDPALLVSENLVRVGKPGEFPCGHMTTEEVAKILLAAACVKFDLGHEIATAKLHEATMKL